MRFEELQLKTADGDLRLRFHPELTVLCGLGLLERQSLADSIVSAVASGDEDSSLRFLDGTGRAVTLVGREGRIMARHDDDGSPAPMPTSLASSNEALRAVMLVRGTDLGGTSTKAREDEPAELREARATLEELSAELQEALGQQQAVADLTAQVSALDDALAAARDGLARREYAQVLAQLEVIRAEAAALQSGTAGIEADRHLLANAESARALAVTWSRAAGELSAASERFGDRDRLDQEIVAAAARVPEEAPKGLTVHVEAVERAQADRDRLDHRLQELAVATLPAPSDPAVAELGVLDQEQLWTCADRLAAAGAEVDRMQVAHGGLGIDDGAPAPAVIAEIEAAHQAVEAAERGAEAVRLPGVALTGLGAGVAAIGAIGAPILMPIGLAAAAIAGVATLGVPRLRIRRASRTERLILAQAEAPSYLSFHMRRVDAAVDPAVREQVDVAGSEQRRAHADWMELVGGSLDVHRALALAAEVREYHTALRNLGGAADEIEQLRRELAQRAEPALATAQAALHAMCDPFGLRPEALADTAEVAALVQRQVHLGHAAREQAALEEAEADELKAAARLDDVLVQHGFADGELGERVRALGSAVQQAGEREAARSRARPRPEIDADLEELEQAARRLRRPEWGDVTAAEAATPDIAELEERRASLAAELTEIRGEVDIERLADRHAAIERRVAALDARHGGHDALGDPAAVAEIHEHLTARLEQAAGAGANGDPVPVVLDEVLLRVPAERKYDLLDALHRQSAEQQLVYLSDDPFVAAWARQQAASGAITLLEPAPA